MVTLLQIKVVVFLLLAVKKCDEKLMMVMISEGEIGGLRKKLEGDIAIEVGVIRLKGDDDC